MRLNLTLKRTQIQCRSTTMRTTSYIIGLCFVASCFGCHWFTGLPGRRKKRDANNQQAISETSTLRSYMAACLAQNAVAPGIDFNSLVDYSILCTFWYLNTDQWVCSQSEDTAQCWKEKIAQYIDATSVLFQPLQDCISQFATDVGNGGPRVTTNRPVRPYASCIQNDRSLVGSSISIDYDQVATFVEEHTVYGYACEGCGCQTSQTTPPGGRNAWAFRFAALTRTDAPLRSVIQNCNDRFFPPDSFWSPWSTWSGCGARCGSGRFESRTRTCRLGSNPSRTTSNQACPGSSFDSRPCSATLCYSWTTWRPWGDCSVVTSCSSGFQSRTRRCSSGDSPPLYDNSRCLGSSSERRTCTTSCNPTWGDWGTWGACSGSCPSKTQQRRRQCLGGSFPFQCIGSATQSRPCSVGCGFSWGDWEPWGACSVNCQQTRRRVCSRTTCVDSQRRSCRSGSCIRWSVWTSWGSCSSSCSVGTRTRSRQCTLVVNQGSLDTSLCSRFLGGDAVMIGACTGTRCPTPRWGEWSRYSSCRVSRCGSAGTRTRSRVCRVGNAQVGASPGLIPTQLLT
ncbi:properdin-like [Ciona intestinalis]